MSVSKKRGFIQNIDGDRIHMWAFTWAEILQTADYRLKYVREQLAINASDDEALDLLKRKYGELIPDAVKEMRLDARDNLADASLETTR